MKKAIYCCEEHVDMAFDDFLLEIEETPDLMKVDKDTSCDYCSEKALYCLESNFSIE
ncbi:CxxH/CxxC protein [Alloiococcus sp. CFN-8]|uniref:CxxH/CxxC protein n=1 Tax=Alloiococcus sp. CFN-8 TaxID=3416081 RepID=UPI003CFB33D2